MWDSSINKHSKNHCWKQKKAQDTVQYEALFSINVCRIQLELNLPQHFSQLWLLILSSLLYNGNITWDAVDWTGPNECCRTAYYIATLCFHASTWEGEGRYDMIVFWLAQNFYWRAVCECERERKQACMTACWVSHCCPPLHSWYSLN